MRPFAYKIGRINAHSKPLPSSLEFNITAVNNTVHLQQCVICDRHVIDGFKVGVANSSKRNAGSQSPKPV